MFVLHTIIFCLIFPDIAGAYVDPGSISMFLQILIAFLIGFLFTLKRVVNKISSVYRWLTGKNKDLPNRKSDNNRWIKLISWSRQIIFSDDKNYRQVNIICKNNYDLFRILVFIKLLLPIFQLLRKIYLRKQYVYALNFSLRSVNSISSALLLKIAQKLLTR